MGYRRCKERREISPEPKDGRSGLVQRLHGPEKLWTEPGAALRRWGNGHIEDGAGIFL